MRIFWAIVHEPQDPHCVNDHIGLMGELPIIGTALDHVTGKFYIVVEAPIDCTSHFPSRD